MPTVLCGLEGFVTIPLPDSTAQTPVPITGKFALSEAFSPQIERGEPTTAASGSKSRCIVMLEETDGHTPLLTVQIKVFRPSPKPLTELLVLLAFTRRPDPALSDHKPDPTVGAWAASVATSLQTLKSVPAIAGPGSASLKMTTSSDNGGQVPLLTVHRKMFSPKDKLLSPDVGFEGSVIVDDPLITVHEPVPIGGKTALS